VAAQDTVAVSSDGVLYLLNLEDGQKLWSKEVSDEISSPALVGGLLVVGADDGTVSAYGEKK
jgi:outer membrane protein assembly factor BamB